MKIDHIGIVVRDLDEGSRMVTGIFPVVEQSRRMHDPLQFVYVRFFRDAGGLIYEVLAPSDQCSPIYRAAKSGQNVLHHLAYSTGSLKYSASVLTNAGCVPLGVAVPGIVYGNKPIQFFLSPIGMVIEIIENPAYAFAWESLPP
jgi:methylmalonyl-CoA/ethylmalonyl-CoA epimerase